MRTKWTIELDGSEMEMYSVACWTVAYQMVVEGKFAEAKKWLVLWKKMKAAKHAFHEEVGRELSKKYLENEEKPTSEM